MYALVRAWATVIQRDLQVAAVDRRHARRAARRLHDLPRLRRGRPPLGHRAPRHARGAAPGRPPDRAASPPRVADAPRPYRLVVLSDHGQSQGATFARPLRASRSRTSCARPATAGAFQAHAGGEDEALAYLGAGLTEVAGDDTAAGRAVASATRERRRRRRRDARPRGARRDRVAATSCPSSSVMASGCLGLVSFPREPGRVTLERLGRAASPPGRRRCASIPGSASSLVRSEQRGAVALGAARRPLPRRGARRGRGPARAVRARTPPRTCAAPTASRTAPTCMVNSQLLRPATEEVAAFEELVGSHGGMGGTQSYPFVLFPSELPWPDDEVVGAETPAPGAAPLARRARPRRLSRRSPRHLR